MKNEVRVDKVELILEVQRLFAQGARLGAISGVNLEDKFEVIYHFELPLEFKHIRLQIDKNDSLPSISNIYLAAAVHESEVKEQLGVNIENLALDYKGGLLLAKESPKAPVAEPVPPRAPVRLSTRCSEACPAGIDIPRYVRLIGEGKSAEALAVIKQDNPFPGICGRVCFAPCEDSCRQRKQWEPIAIRMLKRFAYDHASFEEKPSSKKTGKRVAIIGSGPAGLTAGYFLAKLGHEVVIFEALPEPGGMMRVGIPPHRLPRKVLDEEIDILRKLGVEIKTNNKVESLDWLFEQGYQAILVAVGAHQGIEMGVPGEEHPRVIDCTTFLRSASFGEKVELGDKVIVIGGGNAAIDASRTALRLGSKEVSIFYRRTRAEMPASSEEVEAALHEGVKIEFLAAPSKVFGKDDAISLELIRMKLGEPDASGRPRPIPIEGSEFSQEVNTVITAIGQRPEYPEAFGLKVGRGNVLEADPETLITSREGVFGAGDAVSGPSSVVEAIGAGKKAAISIDKYLGGEGKLLVEEIKVKESTARHTFLEREKEKREVEIPIVDGSVKTVVERKRPEMPCLSLEQRLKGFDEVELGLTKEAAVAEGQRCWRCDLEW